MSWVSDSSEVPHRPVLVEEVLRYLVWRDDGLYVDATVGAGGHAEAILRSHPQARVLGIDADASAVDLARQRLQGFGSRFEAVHSNFRELNTVLKERDLSWVDGILADLGVSSMQLDEGERGFSFTQDGPLDMRMDTQAATSAAEIVNQLSEQALADLIFKYGEERYSRRIARAIVSGRPITTTRRLAEVIARCFPRARKYPIHPATRTFQALRIEVNDELDVLTDFLDHIPDWLPAQGRAVLISFHSLEDRLVKQAMREWQRRELARILTKHVVVAGETERRQNRRSRSAKLRAAERLAAVDADDSKHQRPREE
ncbi:MAG: 16S rRNA (cytosine(1402)-N(4))-methyltransferase RsmH [Acidobacteriia bacterium]|nr:16S rRNA (cytosine(1402)-N(4))-methyltransferase RsmH [Terriglobia bacterium]